MIVSEKKACTTGVQNLNLFSVERKKKSRVLEENKKKHIGASPWEVNSMYPLFLFPLEKQTFEYKDALSSIFSSFCERSFILL